MNTATVPKQYANLRPAWPKGVTGNPAGRPKGSKNRLTEGFLEALAKDFETHGEATLVSAREKDPLGYLNIIARLCPKELELKRPLGEMTDEELHAGFEAIRSFVEGSEGDGAEDSEPAGK